MSSEAACYSGTGESMEPYLINSFTTAAFRAYKNFGNNLEGNYNTELIRAEQVSNISNSDQAAMRLSCTSSPQHLSQGLQALSRTLS